MVESMVLLIKVLPSEKRSVNSIGRNYALIKVTSLNSSQMFNSNTSPTIASIACTVRDPPLNKRRTETVATSFVLLRSKRGIASSPTFFKPKYCLIGS